MLNGTTLNALRDIHLPSPIGVWPFATSIYLIILCCMLGFVGIFIYRYLARFKRAGLKQLKDIKKQYRKQGDQLHAVVELSHLLRRVALLRFPEQSVAGLQGKAWFSFLDRAGKMTCFTRTYGVYFYDALYQQRVPDNLDELFTVIKRWIKRVYR